MKKIIPFLILLLAAAYAPAQPKLAIDLNKKGVTVSPTHYGIFFEDINHAADGGLYAELIRNRSFEDATTLDNWTTFNQTGTSATATVETSGLLNSAQTQALKLAITTANTSVRAGIYNPGFWGINVVNGRQYKVTFFAKCDANFAGSIKVSLESAASAKYAEATVTGLTTGWQKFSCTLTASGNDRNARFVISSNYSGTLWFDVVSVFPPTFNNRENGLRPDLAQLLVDLKPKFVRFPGGCFIEGDFLANRFQWKKTVGNIENRPGHINLWGYRTSDGMGYHEFLQLCEDLNAEPLYVANVGLAHNDNQPYTALNEYIQDALDALEYANGPVTSTYGAMRASNGHPAPFNIKYIEIGNENYFGDNYGNRYIQFYNAIKAKYPDMQCIGNVAAWGTDNPAWTFTHPVQLLDEHYYRSPQWFINQYNKYDTYSRTGPKIYAGEYAVTSGCGNGNLIAAIGEAVYMAGMEKNTDVVTMNSYAPIFVNVNDRKWNPDMIVYNASSVYCTPSYYVQKMFANNVGTVTIPVKDSLNSKLTPVTGSVGLGTWATKADYSNVSVQTPSGEILFSDSFTSTSNWNSTSGNWAVSGGVYSQSSTSTDCRSIAANIQDTTYTYSLKARKTSGNEGFLIIFGYKDANNFYWWNIGGWGNTQHAIEQCTDGSKSVLTQAPGSVTLNQWYDIRIEISKSKMLFYLNNELIHSLDNLPALRLFTSATLDEAGQKLYLKVVNPETTDITAGINLNNASVSSISGKATVLSSANGLDENTLDNMQKIIPVESYFTAGKNFNYNFKASSVTVLQLNTGVVNIVPALKKNENKISVYPNPAGQFLYIKGLEGTPGTVEIRNSTGQVVAAKSKINSSAKVNISLLKPGAYVAVVENGSRVQSAKFFKE